MVLIENSASEKYSLSASCMDIGRYAHFFESHVHSVGNIVE